MMSYEEQKDFRLFCQQATPNQLRNIAEDEKNRAKGGNDYYVTCAAIAHDVANERGIM